MLTIVNFLPSNSGLHFSNNDFKAIPLKTIEFDFVVGKISIPIGDASNGLCGGMVFTVRDYFEAGLQPPPDKTPPDSGTLYDYIVDRLITSFELPFGPIKYLELMSPTLADHETVGSKVGVGSHGRAWRMIKDEWPAIKSDIDNNTLCPIGLVQVKSANPLDLSHNHVVLVYGYEINGTQLTLKIYDPNNQDEDDANISLDLSRPKNTTKVSRSHGAEPIYSFFKLSYDFSQPPQSGIVAGIKANPLNPYNIASTNIAIITDLLLTRDPEMCSAIVPLLLS